MLFLQKYKLLFAATVIHPSCCEVFTELSRQIGTLQPAAFFSMYQTFSSIGFPLPVSGLSEVKYTLFPSPLKQGSLSLYMPFENETFTGAPQCPFSLFL